MGGGPATVTGPAIVIAALAAGPLIAAAIVALRASHCPRNLPVVGYCLFGTLGVGVQIVIASRAPAAQAGFLAGTVGGWFWYLAWLRSGRGKGRSEQTLAVGGLLWIGATIVVTVILAGSGWPVWWSGGLAALLGAGTAALDGATERVHAASPVVAAFGLPAVAGAVFGPDILFVLCLIWTVVGLILWSLVRIEQARRDGRLRSG
ncbi:hypothetical protein [Halovenus halobia]|uniref:hypothetical protein n=1 Tax=Halovenus halobia TaxID=3396622 RepID=UPI003F5748D3